MKNGLLLIGAVVVGVAVLLSWMIQYLNGTPTAGSPSSSMFSSSIGRSRRVGIPNSMGTSYV